MMRHRVMIMTTGTVYTVTRQEVSLHQRNTAEGKTGMIKICATSSAARSKTGIRSASISNRSSMKKGTMTTMVLITTNLTDSVLPKEGLMQEESGRSPKT
jgi:uncharacterized membrane protein